MHNLFCNSWLYIGIRGGETKKVDKEEHKQRRTKKHEQEGEKEATKNKENILIKHEASLKLQ